MSKNWVASSLGQFSRGWPVFPKSNLSGSDSILVPSVAPKLVGYKSTEALDNDQKSKIKVNILCE